MDHCNAFSNVMTPKPAFALIENSANFTKQNKKNILNYLVIPNQAARLRQHINNKT